MRLSVSEYIAESMKIIEKEMKYGEIYSDCKQLVM